MFLLIVERGEGQGSAAYFFTKRSYGSCTNAFTLIEFKFTEKKNINYLIMLK